MKGIIISIDFEMAWGIHDHFNNDKHKIRDYLYLNDETVKTMLKLFREFDISSTWATVGAIACENSKEYLSIVPDQPKYLDSTLKLDSSIFADKEFEKYFFAPYLIEKILLTPRQELGSHSFSHLYFADPGITESDFLTDIKNLEELWKRKFNLTPVSFVFPRNQVSYIYLLGQTTIKIWRDNEKPSYYDFKRNDYFSRAIRFIDSLNPWVKRSTFQKENFSRNSLFIRFNLPQWLWALHLRRVENELKNLKDNQVFHIYWHPHNLNYNTQLTFNRMKKLLTIINNSRKKYGIQSYAMKDLIKF